MHLSLHVSYRYWHCAESDDKNQQFVRLVFEPLCDLMTFWFIFRVSGADSSKIKIFLKVAVRRGSKNCSHCRQTDNRQHWKSRKQNQFLQKQFCCLTHVSMCCCKVVCRIFAVLAVFARTSVCQCRKRTGGEKIFFHKHH